MLVKENWNLQQLYISREDWECDLKDLLKASKNGWEHISIFKGKLSKGSKILRELLNKFFSSKRSLEKVYMYAKLKHDEDMSKALHKSDFDICRSMFYQFQKTVSWIEPEILQISQATLRRYLSSKSLQEFRFFLKKMLDVKKHVLSAELEELQANFSKVRSLPNLAFSALNNVDLKFGRVKDSYGKDHVLNNASYKSLVRSKDRKLRENSFKQLHTVFGNFENTICALLSGEVESHICEKKIRGYKSSLHMSLSPNGVDVNIYHSLLEVVRQECGLLQDYLLLKKELLNVDRLEFWDIHAPLHGEIKHFDFNDSVRIVVDSISILGKDYQDSLRKGLEYDGWVDPYHREGKHSGAYSSGCYDSYPYILMNYQGTISDVLTLSHEAGHSMHSLLSNRSQPYQYASYPIFIAEVASTFNEFLTYEYLFEISERKEGRIEVLKHQIESIIGTFFRQVMFADFELRIHEIAEKNIPLVPDLLKKEYVDLYKLYFGNSVSMCDEISFEFMRIPHFYYNFYVYQYATGICTAVSLLDYVKKKGSNVYLNLLSSGGSDYPTTLLKSVGVDCSGKKYIHNAIALLKKLLEKLRKEIV